MVLITKVTGDYKPTYKPTLYIYMDHLMKPSFCWDDSTSGPMPKAQVEDAASGGLDTQVDARKSFQVQSIQRYLSIYLSIHPSIYLIYLIYLSIYKYIYISTESTYWYDIFSICFGSEIFASTVEVKARILLLHRCSWIAYTTTHLLIARKIAPNQASTWIPLWKHVKNKS